MKKIFIIYAWYIACAALIILGVTSCGTVKKTTKSETQTSETSESQTVTQTNTTTETRSFGDTLKGGSFLPFFPVVPAPLAEGGAGQVPPADQDTPQTIHGESNGIKIKLKVKPTRDNKGQVNGAKVEFEAIAKPKEITNKTEQSSSTQTTKGNKKATTKTRSEADVKAGWSVPAWLWVVFIIVAGCAIAVAFKRSLNAIKKRMKIP